MRRPLAWELVSGGNVRREVPIARSGALVKHRVTRSVRAENPLDFVSLRPICKAL